MRFEPPTPRCARWNDCPIRMQFGTAKCISQGRVCEYLQWEMVPVGKEYECVVRARKWGTGVGVVIPARTVQRLSIGAGEEIRLYIKKSRVASAVP